MAMIAKYQSTSHSTLEHSNNPFIALTYEYLVLVGLYFVVYEVTVPILKMLLIESIAPYAFTRFLLYLIHKFLLFAPIFFLRKQSGVFHPLIFLTFLSVAQSIMEEPNQLFSFLMLESVLGKVHVTSGPLTTYNQAELSFLEIKLLLLTILAQISLYIGYFVNIRWNTFKLPQWPPKRLKIIVLPIILVSLIGIVVYVQSRGGLTTHFSSFGLGRENAVGEDGFIHVLINFGFLAMLIWFTFDDKAYKNPFFWFAFATTIPAQFVLRGSRSSLIFAALLVLLMYMIKSKKIPAAKIIVLSIMAMIAIGVLGALRKSTFGNRQVNWEILSDFSIGSSFELYMNDVAGREGQQPELTALAKGVQTQGLLWGQTYLGGFFFFIPRAIWSDKPHSIGYYTGTLLYGSQGGKPPGDVVEAYWNFHVPGVIFVFFLYGTFLNWLARMLVANSGNAAFYVIFIIVLFYFRPSNLGLIKGFQQLLPLLLLLWLIRVIPPRFKFNH
jgi:oligosaccharide repeat unit polymerase